ncbi:hypothetical protein DUPY_43860 [Duganella phyllosphaerae]|uniref:Uncharacterized protein n=1 Tax=Duganella phyllosphaerae TaxID=762836 RepID=A0A1E7WCJ8_9BURK|nr:hypothetical protein DUPY_43860 [Duganella phyllosphaerae]
MLTVPPLATMSLLVKPNGTLLKVKVRLADWLAFRLALSLAITTVGPSVMEMPVAAAAAPALPAMSV